MKNAMPIIVANYAKAFNIKVRMQGSYAYTDGREIVIPRLNLTDDRIARLAYGYLAHEAAHVRYTDFKIVKSIRGNFTFFSLFNVLEDARIERLIGREFIGVWENLEFLRSSFDEHLSEFLNKHKHPFTLIFSFISYYLCVKSQGFASQRKNTLLLFKEVKALLRVNAFCKLIFLIKKAPYLKNSSAVLKLCEEIGELLSLKDSYKNTKALSQSDLQAINGKDFLKESRFLRDDNLFAKVCLNKTGKAYVGADKSVLLNYEAAKDNGSSRDDLGVVGPCVCKNGNPQAVLAAARDLYPLKRALMLSARAFVDRKRSGRQSHTYLDTKHLSRLFMYDDRLFLKKEREEDFSTYIHVLVDVSGSMMIKEKSKGRMRSEIACSCAYCLAKALEGIDGIFCEVTFFPGFTAEYEIALKHNEKVSSVIARFDQKPRGSTPLAQALWYALGRQKEFSFKRSIFIVITDGVPDSVAQTVRALEFAKELSCEVYGFGIESTAGCDLFTSFTVVNDIGELPKAVFNTLYMIFKKRRNI